MIPTIERAVSTLAQPAGYSIKLLLFQRWKNKEHAPDVSAQKQLNLEDSL